MSISNFKRRAWITIFRLEAFLQQERDMKLLDDWASFQNFHGISIPPLSSLDTLEFYHVQSY